MIYLHKQIFKRQAPLLSFYVKSIHTAHAKRFANTPHAITAMHFPVSTHRIVGGKRRFGVNPIFSLDEVCI